MRADVVVAEIGSTTTMVNAFQLKPKPCLLAQGLSPTTVEEGDVTVGLRRALDDMARRAGVSSVEWDEMMASSSAAGGLRMSVHGLVYDMTVKAAQEAALGAGAVVRMVTAGEMTPRDVERLRDLRPNIILLAGGVDHGDRRTAIHNARCIRDSGIKVPVVYAGNVDAREEVGDILREAGIPVRFVDNVYPRVDELVVEPARKVIQEVFQEHIVTAPGMDTIRGMVTGPILPTPGAVMASAELIWPILGDLVVLDVGGATTDVHSVAAGSPEIQDILDTPEPFAKRTVEGDLGIHRNAWHVYEAVKERIERDLGFSPEPELHSLQVIPADERHRKLVTYLARAAAHIAFERHVGKIRYLYGPEGRITVAHGKDLTSVKWIIGTGGPLTRLPGGKETLEKLVGDGPGRELYPRAASVLLDKFYVMASAGVLSRKYPDEAREICLQSLGVEVPPREPVLAI